MWSTFLILIVSLLFCTTTCAVYNVTPDDTTCHHCHNLQHYLLNSTKYFTSGTQLLFLPGLHHLHTNLIIQNVHNISLIGSTTNGTTPDTVIQCDSSVGIVMNNITSLVIKNMLFQKCLTNYQSMKVAIVITECSFMKLYFVHIKPTKKQLSLMGINILGHSYLTYITCYSMHLHYHESDMMQLKNSTISISHYCLIGNIFGEFGLFVSLTQHSYEVTLNIFNTTADYLKRLNFLHVKSIKTNICNKVIIKSCQFKYTTSSYRLGLIKLLYLVNVCANLSSCSFMDNIKFRGVITAVNNVFLTIDHCIFLLQPSTSARWL